MNRRQLGACVVVGIAGCLEPRESESANQSNNITQTDGEDPIEEDNEFDTPTMQTLADEIRDAVDYTSEALEIEIEADPIVDMDEWHRSIDVRGKVGSLAFAELALQHGAVVSAVMAGPDDHGDDVTRVWFRSLDELAETRETNDLPEWQANQSDNRETDGK